MPNVQLLLYASICTFKKRIYLLNVCSGLTNKLSVNRRCRNIIPDYSGQIKPLAICYVTHHLLNGNHIYCASDGKQCLPLESHKD